MYQSKRKAYSDHFSGNGSTRISSRVEGVVIGSLCASNLQMANSGPKSHTFPLYFVGDSGFRPATWQSQLFYIFAVPFGFALYVIIIISFAYHIRDAMQTYVTSLEKKSNAEIAFLNSKILAISFMTCVCVLQIGAVASIFRKHSYLYGLYLSVDLMTFVGNEAVLERGQAMKVYYSFAFSFYLMILHSVLLVFISSCCHAWKEISDVCSQRRSVNCFQSGAEPLATNYKEKLLASFDSSSSGTPPNEVVVGDEAYFPQFDDQEMAPHTGLDIIDSDEMKGTERRDSHFSEIFNAQKNNFEPIEEGLENFDADIIDASSEKSLEREPDLRTTGPPEQDKPTEKESEQGKPRDDEPMEEPVYFFNESGNFSDYKRDIEKEGQKDDVEKLLAESGANIPVLIESGANSPFLIESGANSPTGSTPSLPSSYSNISLDNWEDDESEDETLSGTRLSRDLETLESSLLGDSSSTITQK